MSRIRTSLERGKQVMSSMKRSLAGIAVIVVLVASAMSAKQPTAPRRDTLPDGPQVFDASTRGPSGRPIPGPKFRIVPTKGLSYPYGLAFLPNGDILVTERAGRLRLLHGGLLDPEPIAGIPEVLDRNLKGLNDIGLHPRFAENHWIYFT